MIFSGIQVLRKRLAENRLYETSAVCALVLSDLLSWWYTYVNNNHIKSLLYFLESAS